jgi:hypothetical protein
MIVIFFSRALTAHWAQIVGTEQLDSCVGVSVWGLIGCVLYL